MATQGMNFSCKICKGKAKVHAVNCYPGLEDGHLAETSEQNNIDPEGRLEEVEAPEGSPETWLEQDGQSGKLSSCTASVTAAKAKQWALMNSSV